MNCPKRPEMMLYGKLIKNYPDLLGGKPVPGDAAVDDTPLLEPQIEFDPDAPADLVIKNALLGTEQPKTVDIAVADNVITKVGAPEEIAAVTTDKTTVLDAGGCSVVPGFVDSHLHLAVAMQRLRACDVESVKTADDFKKKVAAHAKAHPDENVLYVFGLHYFDDPIIPADTCRHVLDDIVSDRPLLVYAHDLHTAWANTKALEEAEVFHKMPPYPHLVEELGLQEKIVVDADQMPTGEFREPEVYYFVGGPLQAKFPVSVEQQMDDLEKVCQQLTSRGITGVHRMGLAQPSEDIAFLLLLLEMEQKGRLPLRVNTSVSAVADAHMLKDTDKAHRARVALREARQGKITAADLHDELLALLDALSDHRHEHVCGKLAPGTPGHDHPHREKIKALSEHIRHTTHAAHVKPHADRDNPHRADDMPTHLSGHAKTRCDTIKIFMDGVIEKDTAFRLDKDPTPGIPEFTQKDLDQLLPCADRLGMQVAAHCIGDGSVKFMLNAIAKAREENKESDDKRGHRIPHRVEHIETCHQEDLPRFGSEHVVTSMQPLHERPPVTMWHTLVPKNEWNTAFAWREALTDGAVLVFGSDWPIVSCDVRTGIHHAVTRQPWYEGARGQAVTLDQAVAAYTAGAAFTEYSAAIKGAVQPGMLADMAILSGSVTELAKEEYDLDINCTICDGKIVYERESPE